MYLYLFTLFQMHLLTVWTTTSEGSGWRSARHRILGGVRHTLYTISIFLIF